MKSYDEELLDDLLAYDGDRRMSEWEVEFIESLNAKRNRDLSDKQANRLQEIYDKMFG